MTDERKAGERALPSGAFSGRNEFQQLVRDALGSASREGWPLLILADATFSDWPLGERAVAQSLHDWSAAGRRCVLLARTWDGAIRSHARFVDWRRRWSHIVEARACPSADPIDFPSAIWTPSWVLRRLDPERSNGVSGDEPQRRVALREELNEWMGRSTPSFAATTLGL